jgi:peroxiredoxin
MDDKINQDKVQSGRKAPDVALTLSDGSQRRLSDFWQEGRLVLVLLRHLG